MDLEKMCNEIEVRIKKTHIKYFIELITNKTVSQNDLIKYLVKIISSKQISQDCLEIFLFECLHKSYYVVAKCCIAYIPTINFGRYAFYISCSDCECSPKCSIGTSCSDCECSPKCPIGTPMCRKIDPLLNMAYLGKLKQVKFLVEMGANVNHENYCGDTAVMIAFYRGYIDVAKYLMSKGAVLRSSRIGIFDRVNIVYTKKVYKYFAHKYMDLLKFIANKPESSEEFMKLDAVSELIRLGTPVINESEVTKPEIIKSEVTKDETTKDEITKPEITKSGGTKDEITKPEITKSEVTKYVTLEAAYNIIKSDDEESRFRLHNKFPLPSQHQKL